MNCCASSRVTVYLIGTRGSVVGMTNHRYPARCSGVTTAAMTPTSQSCVSGSGTTASSFLVLQYRGSTRTTQRFTPGARGELRDDYVGAIGPR